MFNACKLEIALRVLSICVPISRLYVVAGSRDCIYSEQNIICEYLDKVVAISLVPSLHNHLFTLPPMLLSASLHNASSRREPTPPSSH